MQNIIRPNFNQTQNIVHVINGILQRKMPPEFLEGVQKIIAEKLSPEKKKNKFISFLDHCDSAILSHILASIITECYRFNIK